MSLPLSPALFHRRQTGAHRCVCGRGAWEPRQRSHVPLLLQSERVERVLVLRIALNWARVPLGGGAGSLAGGSHRRDTSDFGGVVRPWLQVLQGKERRVVHTQWICGQGLSQALLEGLLLQLQEDAVRLLPLSLALLCCLPPASGTSCYQPRL